VTDDPKLVANKWIQTYRNQMCYIEPKDSEMARAHKKLWKEYKKLMQKIIQDPTNDKFLMGQSHMMKSPKQLERLKMASQLVQMG
jgi:hypothetical protein